MIREIKECELKPLLDLYTHLHEENALVQAEQLKAVWVDILSDRKIRYFVMEENNRLVACCHIVLVPNLTRGARPYALIENVVTHRDFRRRGYGKRLLEHSLRWAWERDCYKVMLMSGRSAREVDNFYCGVGFDRGAKQAYVMKNPEL